MRDDRWGRGAGTAPDDQPADPTAPNTLQHTRRRLEWVIAAGLRTPPLNNPPHCARQTHPDAPEQPPRRGRFVRAGRRDPRAPRLQNHPLNNLHVEAFLTGNGGSQGRISMMARMGGRGVVRMGLLGRSGAGSCPNLLQRPSAARSVASRSAEYQRFSSGVSARSGPLQQIWVTGAVAGPCADGGLGDHPGTRAGLPTPGRLFSGRLRAFPGNDIMMAHSHEVQFVVEQAREDRLNNRILVLPGGRLVRASDPYPGSMHDVAALDASGLLEGIDPSRWIADKGYVGRGMITPHKKPPNGELSEAAKEASKSINRIRRAERADHRPHQVLENPPHRLPAPPAHIRADHHRRTLILRLQNHPTQQ